MKKFILVTLSLLSLAACRKAASEESDAQGARGTSNAGAGNFKTSYCESPKSFTSSCLQYVEDQRIAKEAPGNDPRLSEDDTASVKRILFKTSLDKVTLTNEICTTEVKKAIEKVPGAYITAMQFMNISGETSSKTRDRVDMLCEFVGLKKIVWPDGPATDKTSIDQDVKNDQSNVYTNKDVKNPTKPVAVDPELVDPYSEDYLKMCQWALHDEGSFKVASNLSKLAVKTQFMKLQKVADDIQYKKNYFHNDQNCGLAAQHFPDVAQDFYSLCKAAKVSGCPVKP